MYRRSASEVIHVRSTPLKRGRPQSTAVVTDADVERRLSEGAWVRWIVGSLDRECPRALRLRQLTRDCEFELTGVDCCFVGGFLPHSRLFVADQLTRFRHLRFLCCSGEETEVTQLLCFRYW